MNSSDSFGSSSSDDDDDEGGWLSHSNFGLGNPPVSARHSGLQRRPLSTNGFDVSDLGVVLPSSH
jgi:serine/threonine-protein phosphatase 6 regulatory subunit 3